MSTPTADELVEAATASQPHVKILLHNEQDAHDLAIRIITGQPVPSVESLHVLMGVAPAIKHLLSEVDADSETAKNQIGRALAWAAHPDLSPEVAAFTRMVLEGNDA